MDSPSPGLLGTPHLATAIAHPVGPHDPAMLVHAHPATATLVSPVPKRQRIAHNSAASGVTATAVAATPCLASAAPSALQAAGWLPPGAAAATASGDAEAADVLIAAFCKAQGLPRYRPSSGPAEGAEMLGYAHRHTAQNKIRTP